MIGNDQVRFCEHCNLHVTNLSSMTRYDAMHVVARSQGRLCVRYIQRPNRGVPEKLHRIGRRVSRIAAGTFTAALSLSSAAAQSTSQSSDARREQALIARALPQPENGRNLSGVIIDPMGAVVSGAKVTLTNVQTSLAYAYTTGDDGAFKFLFSDVGRYHLTVEAQGFAKKEIRELDLKPDDNRAVNVELELPEIMAQVEIKASSTETQSVTMGVVAFVEPEDPLVKAAFKNDLDGVKQLLFVSTDINATDPQANANAMDYAVEHGNREMVQVLLSAGADVNARNRDARTSLMYLGENASAEMVRDLLSFGADVNARDGYGVTPLMKAAASLSFPVLKQLIDAGAGIDAKDNHGATVLMSAAENEDGRTLRLLIGAGVDLNAKNEDDDGTALIVAARSGRADSVKALLNAGAEIESKTSDGKTALLSSAANDDPEAARVLIDAGADVNAKDKDGKTPLIIASDEGDPETVKALLNAGARINERDNDGWSALMYAASTRDEERVKALLNAGADVTLKNKEGRSALSLARENGHNEVVKLLEARGAPE
jgi:ankyrin repeat protein